MLIRMEDMNEEL